MNDSPRSVGGDLRAMRKPVKLHEHVDFPLAGRGAHDRCAHDAARRVAEDAERVAKLVAKEDRGRRARRVIREDLHDAQLGAIVRIGAIHQTEAGGDVQFVRAGGAHGDARLSARGDKRDDKPVTDCQ